jgi:hypothetical protein
MVTKGIDAWLERGRRNIGADFAALYLAIALEDYATRCAIVVQESENFESSEGQIGEGHANLAPLPEYPADIDWKAFGVCPTSAAMSFRVDVTNAKMTVSGLWDVDSDSGLELFRKHSIKMGIKALALASGFRKSRRLSSVDHGWVEAYLAEKRKEYQRVDEYGGN